MKNNSLFYIIKVEEYMRKSSKKVIMKKNAKRILIFGFFSLSIIMFVFITIYKIINQINDKYKEAQKLEEKMADLNEQESNLNNEIKKLQDSDYLARYAREKYFYSKDGELIIRIPTNDEKENKK